VGGEVHIVKLAIEKIRFWRIINIKTFLIIKEAKIMSVLQEQAIEMIGTLPDDRVEIIIQVMQGFMSPVKTRNDNRRIGIAEGKFVVPDDFDDCNDEIAEMFGVNG
jgi:hypothetical protein